ncbi:MAG: universal stress protein [Candidatus Limnocylindria bacterium]
MGVDGSDASRDAIALADGLAGLTGSTLVLANVFPYDTSPSRTLNREFEEYLREDASAILEPLRATVDDGVTVETRTVPNPSPAHGLHELAEREEAGLIVVGSTHTGRIGRVLPGSTATRLLHGSPCPVAVAPKGYADQPGRERAIGCGYDGSQASELALGIARRLAEATGVQLQLIRAFQPIAYDIPPGSAALGGAGSYNTVLRERAAEELNAAVERLDGDVDAHFEIGDPAQVLADASEGLDLLLMGSRGYGPLHSVVVGGVAGRVVREAACPVIIFPRSATKTEADSVFARVASMSS